MHEPSLEARLEAMMSELTALRQQVTAQQARLNELESRPTAASLSPNPTTTSRRRMLRRLAGGLVGGLALGGVALATTSPAQARLVSGSSTSIGTFSIAPGGNLPTGNLTPPQGFLPPKYGLLGTDGTTLDLSTLPLSPQSYSAGVVGYAGSGSGSNGVVGINIGTNGNGVMAVANGMNAIGVRADVTGLNVWGIYVSANGDNNARGLYAAAFGPNAVGVYSQATGTNSLAGNFQGSVSITGNLNISGTLSKGGGSFKIDHPQDPANSYLYHSFVESPDMMNIYNGLVTLDGQGMATVELPAWFEALNTDFRYGLTAIGAPSPDLYIANKVTAGKFKIAGGKPGQEVSWQLTGIRQDEWAKAHRIPVEEAKPDHEKGLYLHPELYGQAQEKGINRAGQPKQ